MMTPCPFCKTPIPNDCVYCDICGEKLRKCRSCSAFAKAKFCTKCGSETEDIIPKLNQPDTEVNTPATPNHLVCIMSNLRLGLCHEAIIGRRGSYGNAFQQFPSISGLHAKLIQSGDKWLIEDIGSSYGTYVNGEQLERNNPIEIKVGDIIKFADIDFNVIE